MKTAGSSIEVYLNNQKLGSSIMTSQFPNVSGFKELNQGGFFDHCPASRIREWMGETSWDGFYSFCVERDPWEKVF
jgi:hypothetical protein